jgi:hypothetical protein
MQSARSISEVPGDNHQQQAQKDRQPDLRDEHDSQDKNWSVLETNVKYLQRENAYKRQMPVIALTRHRAKIDYTDLPEPNEVQGSVTEPEH